MTMEERLTRLVTLEKVYESMRKIYRSVSYGQHTYFTNDKGTIFNICLFPGAFALVIEYAEDETAAAFGALEDGDLFCLDEYQDIDALVAAMQEEIEA